jgi:tight adherence protein C
MYPLLAQSIPMETIVPFALFGLFAVAAWWVLDFVAADKSRAVERLDELKNPMLRRKNQERGVSKKSDTMTRVLEKASAAAKPLTPKNEFEANKLKAQLASGGFRGDSATSIFLGLKIVLAAGAFVVMGGTSLLVYGVAQKSLMYTFGAAGLMFFMPNLVLWFIVKNRKDSIFLGLPDALDLLVVCVEAGLGLDQAMRKVSEEMKLTCKVISDEFTLSNFQLQMGIPRADVLHELGARTGVDDLRSLAAILIQADKFGSSIAQALRVQSDSMRTKRRQLAEEKAAKTAVKLIFPLVLFIFPGIFVVLVGPAAITIMRDMFPMMGG